MLLWAICSVGAQEVYIGGGFTVGSEDSEFVFQISPEVGCHLTDQWAVGGEIGYTHYDDYNRFQFAPYARYTFYKTGIVGLFVDGTIGIAAGDGDTGFRLGLRPGLSLKATEHISFVTKSDFLVIAIRTTELLILEVEFRHGKYQHRFPL